MTHRCSVGRNENLPGLKHKTHFYENKCPQHMFTIYSTKFLTNSMYNAWQNGNNPKKLGMGNEYSYSRFVHILWNSENITYIIMKILKLHIIQISYSLDKNIYMTMMIKTI